MMLTVAEQQRRFFHRLDDGDDGRWFAARWLSTCKYTVLLYPTWRAYDRREWRKYVDNGDILAKRSDAGGQGKKYWKRVEIKSSTKVFTSEDDFDYPDLIICACHSFDEQEEKAHIYVTFNSDMTHVAYVHTRTSDSWEKRLTKDRSISDEPYMAYYAPMRCVSFKEVKFIKSNETDYWL